MEIKGRAHERVYVCDHCGREKRSLWGLIPKDWGEAVDPRDPPVSMQVVTLCPKCYTEHRRSLTFSPYPLKESM